MPTLFALDLGTRTGRAALPPSGRIASGVAEFRPGRFEGAGMAFLRFERFLSHAASASGPFDAVMFEEVRAHAGTVAAQVYGGFPSITARPSSPSQPPQISGRHGCPLDMEARSSSTLPMSA